MREQVEIVFDKELNEWVSKNLETNEIIELKYLLEEHYCCRVDIMNKR